MSNVPNPLHMLIVTELRDRLAVLKAQRPGLIATICGSGECKILVEGQESERHPDLAIYRTPPPLADSDVWRVWIPALVIEVVSEESRTRDYTEKREEYLSFGVQEYWIVDFERQQVLVLRRRGGKWHEITVGVQDVYRCLVLPGFELTFAPIFEAAGRLF